MHKLSQEKMDMYRCLISFWKMYCKCLHMFKVMKVMGSTMSSALVSRLYLDHFYMTSGATYNEQSYCYHCLSATSATG